MPQIVGVRFSRWPRTYHFETAGHRLPLGVSVVAESVRGIEVGRVTSPVRDASWSESAAAPKPILRVATPGDLAAQEKNRPLETQAYRYCLERIRAHGLAMKLVDVHTDLDGSRVTVYFTSDGRVDFRALVKDLNHHLRTRVQLLQIGARDAARLIGGIGPCGQELCCSRWLVGFEPISIKMAKDQSLFLNPSKFSGVCGKLMCCLRYEHETYLLARKAMPAIGSTLETPHGPGRVVEQLVPAEKVLVDVPERGLVEVAAPVDVQPVQPRCRNGGGCSASECGNCGSSGCSSCGRST